MAQNFHGARLVGVDFTNKDKEQLLQRNISLEIKNIEEDTLDCADESVDLFIANQVFEHLKELFWVNDQIARKLKVGGYLIIGVPNISSLPSRLLFLFGMQPSQMKSYSAHVRGYAHKEIEKFFQVCFSGGYKLVAKKGSQFYPFPKRIARFFAKIFPTYAHTLFFLFQKQRSYSGEFLEHPAKARLETNFYVGESKV